MSFPEEFEKLRREFAHHSIRRVAEMQDLVDALGREPGNHAVADRLRTHFHAFAGLGTTYGRPEATLLGEQGELRTSVLVQGVAAATAEDVDALRLLVEGLRAQFL